MNIFDNLFDWLSKRNMFWVLTILFYVLRYIGLSVGLFLMIFIGFSGDYVNSYYPKGYQVTPYLAKVLPIFSFLFSIALLNWSIKFIFLLLVVLFLMASGSDPYKDVSFVNILAYTAFGSIVIALCSGLFALPLLPLMERDLERLRKKRNEQSQQEKLAPASHPNAGERDTSSSEELEISSPEMPVGYKLSPSEAAQAIGVTSGILQRYINLGRINVNADETIDTTELLRAGFKIRNLPPPRTVIGSGAMPEEQQRREQAAATQRRAEEERRKREEAEAAQRPITILSPQRGQASSNAPQCVNEIIQKYANVIHWEDFLGFIQDVGDFLVFADRFEFKSNNQHFIMPFDHIRQIKVAGVTVHITVGSHHYKFSRPTFGETLTSEKLYAYMKTK